MARSRSPAPRSTPKKKSASADASQIKHAIIVAVIAAIIFVPSPLRGLLCLDARPSWGSAYPLALAWGNALWGALTFRKHRSELPAASRPGFIWSALQTFVTYTMPANIFTCLLFLGRTPSAFRSPLILPAHLTCCALVELFPALADKLSTGWVYLVIDSLGVLDNTTTQLNFMTEAWLRAAPCGSSIVLTTLAGMCVNVAGGIGRHFAKHGFEKGSASLDATLGPAIKWSLAMNLAYTYFALYACGGDEGCALPGGFKVIHLYEAQPWINVLRNAGVLAPLGL